MIYISPKKRAIPHHVRRHVAREAGAMGVGRWDWVTFKGFDLDHVIPESRGGQPSEDNIVLACTHCNRSKGFRHTAEQMARVA